MRRGVQRLWIVEIFDNGGNVLCGKWIEEKTERELVKVQVAVQGHSGHRVLRDQWVRVLKP